MASFVREGNACLAVSGKPLEEFAAPTRAAGGLGSSYRAPSLGDVVAISGIRRRPELNGAKGEIICTTPDEFGRVTVNVFDDAYGDCRKMKIQPFRLVPVSSSPDVGAMRLQETTAAACGPCRGRAAWCRRAGRWARPSAALRRAPYQTLAAAGVPKMPKKR
ncbi:unnamed protein product, partial [Effrenium voratum]